MRNFIRLPLIVTWSMLLAAALLTAPSVPANAAALPTYQAYMQWANNLAYDVKANGILRGRLSLVYSGGSIFEMTVVDTYNSQWIVTFKLRGTNLCIDKSLDSTTTNAVYLYTCSGTSNQKWLLQKTGTVPGANKHFIRSWHEGASGRCLAVSSTSEVWPCRYGQDEFAIFVY